MPHTEENQCGHLSGGSHASNSLSNIKEHESKIHFCRLVRNGELDNGFKFLESMVYKGEILDIIPCASLIKGFCRISKTRKTYRVTKILEQSRVVLDVITYNVLISGYCKNEKKEEKTEEEKEGERRGRKKRTWKRKKKLVGPTTYYIYFSFKKKKKLPSPYSFSIYSSYSYENIITNLMTSFYYKLFLCNIVIEFHFFKHVIIIGNTNFSPSSFDVLYFIITIPSFVNISNSLIFTYHHTSPCLPHFIRNLLFITLL